MKNFIVYNNITGEILRSGTCTDEDFDVVRSNDSAIEGLGSYYTHYISNSTAIEYTEQQKILKSQKPKYPAAWSNETMSWVDLRSLEQLKVSKWEEVKQARQLADESPLITPYGVFDADYQSQQKIAGAVQLALMAPNTWSIDWTLHDNSVVTLTKSQLVEVGVTLGTRTSSLYEQSRTIRDSINNAESREALALVTWSF